MIRTNAIGELGKTLHVKGVSWSGLERGRCMIGGVDRVGISTVASFLKANGFNAVRIPLAADALLGTAACLPPDSVYWQHNMELAGSLSYTDILEKWIDVLGDYGALRIKC